MANYQENHEETEVNMTPMLDIVFILLIFFIVTAVFVKIPGVNIIKPESENSTRIKRISMLIAIASDDSIWVDKKSMSMEELAIAVDKHRKENPKGKIVITTDGKSSSGVVTSMMQKLHQIGVSTVSIATQERS